MDFLFYDILFCIVFFIIIFIFLRRHKKDVKKEGIFFLYKSKVGIKTIDTLVRKHHKFFHLIEKINIIIGFIGMLAIFVMLIFASYKMAVIPKVIKTPPIMPLLPWVPIPGMPTLYFTIWIVMLGIIAVIHEGAHGIFARLNKVKIKSTGFGALGPIVVAFVEPDEKQVMKANAKAQMGTFAAGPVANFAGAAAFFLIIIFIINPVIVLALKDSSVVVASVENASPAYYAGIKAGDNITINNISTVYEIANLTFSIKPNQTFYIKTDSKEVALTTAKNPKNETMGYTGMLLKAKIKGLALALPFISSLFYWIFMANIFVGLFNLLPFWIVDGGRMYYAAAFAIMKSKKKALKAMKNATFTCLFLIFMIFMIWVVRMFTG